MRSRIDRLSAVALLALAACGGDETVPPVPARVTVTPSAVETPVSGRTFQFTAAVVDNRGDPMPGVPVTWASTSEDVATVSQAGLATVVGQGRANIRATAGPASGRAVVVADLRPAELMKVAGDTQTAAALTQVPENLVVRVTDEADLPLSGVRIDFEVFNERARADPVLVLTNDSGEAGTRWKLGLGEGRQDLRAYVAGTSLWVDFAANATGPPLTVLTTDLPDGRETLPYEATLQLVGGVPPFTWSLASGELPAGLALDSTGLLSGAVRGEGAAEFTVAVRDSAGAEATADLTLRTCPAPLTLDVGQAEVSDPLWPGACFPFLPAGDPGDRYHVAFVRTVERPDVRPVHTELAIREPWPGDTTAAGPAPEAVAAPEPPVQLDVPGFDRESDRRRRWMKAELLDRTERIFRDMDPAALLPDQRGGAQAQRRAAATSTPPSTISLRPTTWEDGPCSSSPPDRVTANLVGYNDFLAIYQDSAQQTTAAVDSAAATAVLDYYAAYGAPTIEEYFGGTTDVNGDGRIVLFVTPVVPSDFAAYVWGPDFLSATACAGSNEMEVVYYQEGMFAAIVAEKPFYQALPTTVHEVAHVASLYRRAATRNWPPRWAEEGRAEIAAEVSSRRALEAAAVVGRTEVLDRSAYPPAGEWIWTPENTGVVLRMLRTGLAYSQSLNSVTFDPVEEHSYYGSAWHFHRFLGDAYGDAAALGDSAFFRQLTAPETAPGTAGIERLTGKSMQALLVEYAIAMATNGTGAPHPERGFSSYDFRSTTLTWGGGPPRGYTYPWPITGAGPAAFADHVYRGYLYPAGIRFHEFESDGRGEGIEVAATVDGPSAKVIIVRVR